MDELLRRTVYVLLSFIGLRDPLITSMPKKAAPRSAKVIPPSLTIEAFDALEKVTLFEFKRRSGSSGLGENYVSSSLPPKGSKRSAAQILPRTALAAWFNAHSENSVL